MLQIKENKRAVCFYLRNVHHRAFLDLQTLQSDMLSQWQEPDGNNMDKDVQKELAARIIRESRKERDRIADYIARTESSIGDRSVSSGLPNRPE